MQTTPYPIKLVTLKGKRLLAFFMQVFGLHTEITCKTLNVILSRVNFCDGVDHVV